MGHTCADRPNQPCDFCEMKPFAKTPQKIVTVTIEESGNAVFLATDSADIFLEMGTILTRRASHVLPSKFWKRQAFRILRTLTPDTGRVAAWTRTWKGPWLVDTKPVGGVVLTGRWMSRQIGRAHV